jgi:beta-lactamase class D
MRNRPLSLLATCLLFVFPSFLSAEENFLLIDDATNHVVVEMGPHIYERFSPCSSFKMMLSLMGYDAGVLLDESTPTWDFHEGYDDWLESWKAPQTPLSWMQNSCVWYSKVLSMELGVEKMQSYLTSMQYGNEDMSGGVAPPGPTEVAWMNSSLKISPREQVDFIQKMLRGKLPVSTHAIEMTRALVFKEELPEGWKLFGKTGYSGSDIARDGKTLEHSWFVGWVEKDHHYFPFAYLIREQKINLAQRIPRVKQLLAESIH